MCLQEKPWILSQRYTDTLHGADAKASKIAGHDDEDSDDGFNLKPLKSMLPHYLHDPESTPSPQPLTAIPSTPAACILQTLQNNYPIATLREQLTLLLLSTFPAEVSLQEIVTNVTSDLSNAQKSMIASPISPRSLRIVNPSSEKKLIKFCLNLAEAAQHTAGQATTSSAATEFPGRLTRAAAKKKAQAADQGEGESENEGSSTVESSDESNFIVFSFLSVGISPPHKRRKRSTRKTSQKKKKDSGLSMAVRIAKGARERTPVYVSFNGRNQVRRVQIMASHFTLCSSVGQTSEQFYGGHSSTS